MEAFQWGRMRELKFRRYDDYCNDFVYYDLKNKNDDEYICFFMPNYPIEQYTGLKDKDGKEIYEGDIVDYNDDGECIGVVKYDDPEFYLEADLEIHARMFLKGAPHQKVIGNIYDNPELLKNYWKKLNENY